MSKIGIMGGTFNPIHLAHVQCAQEVLKKFYLDKILFIPSKIPVHKVLDFNVSSSHRAFMVNLAIADFKNFEISLDEIKRKESSYMYITLQNLRQKYNSAEFYLIIGSDSFNSILKWKNPELITKLCKIVVLKRPGENINKELEIWSENILVADNEQIDISSTEIRENIKKPEYAGKFLNENVYKYIKEKRLYGIG